MASLARLVEAERAVVDQHVAIHGTEAFGNWREHMYLVDYLLGSSVQVCPVGATDSHGQRILADPTSVEEQDNFVTWIGVRE